MKVLVVGSGGREHAICWKIAQRNKGGFLSSVSLVLGGAGGIFFFLSLRDGVSVLWGITCFP